jgi:hypothetical protein
VDHATSADDRSTLAALGHQPRPQAQVSSLRQPGRSDRTRRLRTDDAPDIQRSHAAARLGGEQPGLHRDGRALLDELVTAGIHLHPVTTRSAQSAGACGYGADGTARRSTTEHQRGARHHPSDGSAAGSDQGQLAGRPGRVQARGRVLSDQQQDKRSRCAQQRRSEAGGHPLRKSATRSEPQRAR